MSEARYVKMGIENSYADPTSVVEETEKFMKFLSESITVEKEDIVYEEANRAGRQEAYQGTRRASGDIETYGRPSTIAWWLNALLGSPPTTVDTDPVFTHVWTPERDNIKSWLIEVAREQYMYQFTGMVCTSMNISAERGDGLMLTPSWIGVADQDGQEKEEPSYDDVNTYPIFRLNNSALTIGGEEVCDVKSVSIDVNNNIDEDTFGIGNIDPECFLPKGQDRTIDVSLEINREDESFRQDYLSGVHSELKLVFTSDTMIPMSDPPSPFTLTIVLPNVRLGGWEGNASGRDAVKTSLSGKALIGETTLDLTTYTEDMVVKLVNDQAGSELPVQA